MLSDFAQNWIACHAVTHDPDNYRSEIATSFLAQLKRIEELVAENVKFKTLASDTYLNQGKDAALGANFRKLCALQIEVIPSPTGYFTIVVEKRPEEGGLEVGARGIDRAIEYAVESVAERLKAVEGCDG
tara:strand:- start:2030 stop:2419 length:390 start_codon:yes stop_codon:yes gene_type:complete